MIFNNRLEVRYNSNIQSNYLAHIDFVLDKIPSDISEKICKNCMIIITGTDLGEYFGKTDKEIILLHWFQITFQKHHWKHIRYVIAHEFAHYILNHKQLTKAEQKVVDADQEKEAEELATKWGFPPYMRK